MTRPTKAGDRGKNPLPRNQPDDKTVRCTATEGAQQCLKEQHSKVQNHTWGSRGETAQWTASGQPKAPVRAEAEAVHPVWGDAFVPEVDPAADTLVEELPPDPHGPDPVQARDLEEMERYRAAERQRLADTPTTKTAEARELLRNQAPTGPLASEVHAEALSQGLVKSKGGDEADRADMERLSSHPHVARDGPRPVSVSGAPGSRLADVTSLVSTWTQLGIPVELQDEMTQIQIAKLALDSMLEEIIRTRQPSDPALVTSLMDAVDHIARARGLVRGTGAGS